jgi:hypothetical protein
MNDDASASGTDSANEPSASDAVQKAMSNMVAGMSTAEKLIALGAGAYVVINALLGDMILDDFASGDLAFILTLGALLAIVRHGRGHGRWREFYPWVAEVMAGAFAVLGGWYFLDALFDGFDFIDGSEWFYTIVFWAAAGACGYGAWLLHRAHD